MRAIVVLLVLAAAAAAGCVEIPDAEPSTPPTFRQLTMDECIQTHTFASFPKEVFDGVLPEGWTVLPADPAGRTTQFYLAGSACARALVSGQRGVADLGPYKEVFGYLFVEPPGGPSADVSGDLWPMGGVVSHGDALRAYDAWGANGTVVQGRTEIRFDELPVEIVASRTYADNGEETFEVNAAVPAGSEAFPEGAFRIWMPAGDGAQPTRSIVYAWTPGGEEIGIGGGELSYDGPLGNAPPAHGVVVHHVRGVLAMVEPS